MDWLWRLLLSANGIAVDPDERLEFELSAWPSGGAALLVLLGIALLLAGVIWCYRREAGRLGAGRRWLLGALRGLALLLVVLILFAPHVVAVREDVRPGQVLLLLDHSQSMASTDTYRQPDAQPLAAAWRELGVDPAAVTRLDLVKRLFAVEQGRFLRELAQHNEPRLFAFAAGAEPLDAAGLPGLAATGGYTNPGGAVRAALERSRDASIAAVVLLSDGRRNLGPPGLEVARLIGQRRVPATYVLGTGDPSPTTAVELARVDAPDRVFQRDPFRITASVLAQGYDGATATLELLRLGADDTPLRVASRDVALGRGDAEVDVAFDGLISETAGAATWRVVLRPPAGETPVPERHERQVRIETLAEQTRVLLLSGGPTHEYRILRDTLIRDKTIDVSCWLTSAAKDFPQDGDTPIEALPHARAELEPYDVVLLLDPDSGQMPAELGELLRVHVVEGGAGLWWIAGEKYTLDALRATAPTAPIADLLPVVPDMQEADYRLINLGRAFARPWPWDLTPDGLAHPITRLSQERDENARLWQQLAGAHFAFPIARGKPAALVLAEQRNPAVRSDGGPLPMLAAQFVGAGRVVFLSSDETYRWRSVHKDAYDRFWVRGIRWLHEGRLQAGGGRVRLLLSEARVELGGVVRVTAEVKDDKFRPLLQPQFEVELVHGRGPGQRLALQPQEESPGSYAAILRPEQLGFHLVRATVPGASPHEATFEVVPARIETEGPVDRAELAAIAGGRGGRLFTDPRELLGALAAIPSATSVEVRRTPHAIWDGWGTIALLLVVLSLEWWLRKRVNLP